MADNNDTTWFVDEVVGTTGDDSLIPDAGGDGQTDDVDKVNGNAGSNTIETGDGTDLVAGDMVGNEWQFIDGKWVYDPSAIVDNGDSAGRAFDDVILAGAGADTINAGRDEDMALGGDGDDLINLEWGADTGEGGAGADTINAGDDADLAYGDHKDGNLLATNDATKAATTFAQYFDAGDWAVNTDGVTSMTQTIPTDAAETCAISFELAANMGCGAASGAVHKIDISQVPDGGDPTIASQAITGTLDPDGNVDPGMAKGAYGAVFMDGDGNLNYGDHDLDAATDASGGIYKVNMDWDAGNAVSEFMADNPTTGKNDGAVDPRSSDAFAKVDVTTNVMNRNPEVAPQTGGDNDLLGGDGDDDMYGGGGADLMHGGNDDDMLSGDAGDDKAFGGSERDDVFGGTGSDTIDAGAGNDHMWGGNWSADGGQDTFIVSAGGGKDMIHDFEANHDVIDLSSYGIDYDDVAAVMSDKGWATEIDLSQLTGGQSNDKILLKSVDIADLDEDNFLL